MAISFEEYFKMDEMTSTSVLGPGSDTGMGGTVGNADFYAPGTAVIPKGGKKRKIQRRNLKNKL